VQRNPQRRNVAKKTATPTVAELPKSEIIKQYALSDGENG
jgi:hypothetical protein